MWLRGRPGCLIQSGSECSNYCLDLAHMPSCGEGRTFEPRGPGPPVGRGRGHGSGASSASPTAPTAPPSLPLNSPKNPMFSIISHPNGAAGRPHRSFSFFTGHLSLRPKGATASCRALADGKREGRKRQTGHRGTRLREGRREGGQFSEKATWTTLLREERGKDGGGISATKDTKGTKGEGRRARGTREEGIYKNVSNAAART